MDERTAARARLIADHDEPTIALDEAVAIMEADSAGDPLARDVVRAYERWVTWEGDMMDKTSFRHIYVEALQAWRRRWRE